MIGTRKFLFNSFLAVLMTVVALVGKMSGEYAGVMTILAVGLNGANLGEHWAKAYRAKNGGA
jgi:hypothetical protein